LITFKERKKKTTLHSLTRAVVCIVFGLTLICRTRNSRKLKVELLKLSSFDFSSLDSLEFRFNSVGPEFVRSSSGWGALLRFDLSGRLRRIDLLCPEDRNSSSDFGMRSLDQLQILRNRQRRP
jgi:hypothetical protein